MERGNTKHGRVRDEELAHETEGMVRGGAQRPHTEDWRAPEPVDDAIPPVTRGRARPEVQDRAELARIMTRDWFPAGRDDLLRRLDDAGAAPGLLERVTGLPAGDRFGGVHDVLEALGISSPETRPGSPETRPAGLPAVRARAGRPRGSRGPVA